MSKTAVRQETPAPTSPRVVAFPVARWHTELNAYDSAVRLIAEVDLSGNARHVWVEILCEVSRELKRLGLSEEAQAAALRQYAVDVREEYLGHRDV